MNPPGGTRLISVRLCSTNPSPAYCSARRTVRRSGRILRLTCALVNKPFTGLLARCVFLSHTIPNMQMVRTVFLFALVTLPACSNSNPPPAPTGPATTTGTIAQSPSGTGIAGVTTFTFTAVNFIATTGGTLSYTWDFGDGTAALDARTSNTHPFPAPGTFAIKLSVANSKGTTAVLALISGLQVVSLS